ncbi:MAG: ATP-binding protein [Alkalilacustris sp.]
MAPAGGNVADTVAGRQTLAQTAQGLKPAAWTMLGLSVAMGGLAIALPGGGLQLAFASGAGTLACLTLLVTLLGRRQRLGQTTVDQVADLIAHDPSPGLATTREGRVLYQNIAAQNRFGDCRGQRLEGPLGRLLPNPGAMLLRLRTRAVAQGAAREQMEAKVGPLRVSVHRIGGDGLLWRFEETGASAGDTAAGAQHGLPMLTAARSGTILAMNEAMRRLLGDRPESLGAVFPYLPLRCGEETVIAGADGPRRCIVAEVEGAAGQRDVFLLPLADTAAPAPATRPDFEALPLALAQLTPEGRLLQANRYAREILGLAALGPLPELRLAELLEGPGRPVEDWLADAMSGLAENRPQVLRLRRADPETFLQVTLRRVAGNGRPGLLAVFNDATELKSLEAQIVQSQKMQAIGQLAGGVAHDFNNLLTAISGHCDLLLLRHDRGDPDYADLVQIHQNANRAASLVRQLLAFSRKQTLQPEVFDLRDTLAELTHLLSRLVGEKILLSLHHDPDLRSVRADRRQIEQVIMNLVVNARDAMPKGGEIRIETENRTLRGEVRRDRAVVPPGDYVVVSVRDEGVGIPPERADKVFEPFFTTKRTGEGTGLGLSTAYGIVKQTGGFIFFDSTPGLGTLFTIFLPACDLAAETATAPKDGDDPTEAVSGQDGAGVILLVEDEAPVRAFAARALRLQGHKVLDVETGEDALNLLDNPDLHIDVFLSDVIMPGMDGPSWVREALKARPAARVVFMSGYAEEALSTGRTAVPNAVFLPKPFSLSDLTKTVQRQLVDARSEVG